MLRLASNSFLFFYDSSLQKFGLQCSQKTQSYSFLQSNQEDIKEQDLVQAPLDVRKVTWQWSFFNLYPLCSNRTDLTKFLGPKQHHVPIQRTDLLRIRGLKSWLQPSTGHPRTPLITPKIPAPVPRSELLTAYPEPSGGSLRSKNYIPAPFAPQGLQNLALECLHRCHAVLEVCGQPRSQRQSYVWAART